MPSRVWLLFQKDLLRRWRSPLGVLAMIAFPLVFSGMMALAFGGSDDPPLRARLLLEDLDDNFAGGVMKSFLGAEQVSDFLEIVEVGEGEGLARLENDEASALLRIPAGTTEKLFDGEAVTLELVRNPAQTILPEVAEQIAAMLAEVVSLAAGFLHRQAAELELPLGSIEDFDDLAEEDFVRLAVATRHALSKGGSFVSEPPITLETVTLGEPQDGEPNEEGDEDEDEDASPAVMIVLFILPGISVYSLFIIGDQMMRDVLTETQLGTLRRQLCAPVTGGQIIAAKVLVTAVVAGIVLLILAAFVAVLAPEPVDLAAFVLLSLALVLAITGFAATIYGLVSTERQGGTISAVVYLAMAFSGGSFVPLDNMPAAVRSMAPLSPFYWGTRGFQDLLTGGGLAEALGPVAVLGGLGLVLLATGAVLLQRKVLRGEAG